MSDQVTTVMPTATVVRARRVAKSTDTMNSAAVISKITERIGEVSE